MYTRESVLKDIQDNNIELIDLQFTDILGAIKSVTIPSVHLEDIFERGLFFDGSSIQGTRGAAASAGRGGGPAAMPGAGAAAAAALPTSPGAARNVTGSRDRPRSAARAAVIASRASGEGRSGRGGTLWRLGNGRSRPGGAGRAASFAPLTSRQTAAGSTPRCPPQAARPEQNSSASAGRARNAVLDAAAASRMVPRSVPRPGLARFGPPGKPLPANARNTGTI